MLDDISKEAWGIIATTFDETEKLPAKSSVAEKATTVAFSERLLRDIINLSDSQQLELVKDISPTRAGMLVGSCSGLLNN